MKLNTVKDLLDFIQKAAQNNPDLLDMSLDGFFIHTSDGITIRLDQTL